MDTTPTPAFPAAASGGPPFWERPGVVTALRSLSLVVGLIGAGIALFLAGFGAAVADCSGDATGLCTNYAGVVPVLEWAIVLVAFAAPLAGGIVACVRKEWPWLALGLFTAALMIAALVAVSEGQTLLLA